MWDGQRRDGGTNSTLIKEQEKCLTLNMMMMMKSSEDHKLITPTAAASMPYFNFPNTENV
jgi:hypothetical protein